MSSTAHILNCENRYEALLRAHLLFKEKCRESDTTLQIYLALKKEKENVFTLQLQERLDKIAREINRLCMLMSELRKIMNGSILPLYDLDNVATMEGVEEELSLAEALGEGVAGLNISGIPDKILFLSLTRVTKQDRRQIKNFETRYKRLKNFKLSVDAKILNKLNPNI